MSDARLVSRRSWPLVAGAGVALGVAYTLSPLTVLGLTLLVWVAYRAGRDLGPRERRWFFTIVTMAIAVRLLVIAGLFLLADPAKPYATFFGDEELFKSRTVWLRNIGLGVPISKADVIYAFDDTGKSGYLYVLAYLQALVGDAPYGIHVFNVACYVTGVLLLFRLVRPAYGTAVALGGMTLLFFLPSLFVWSVSALKEPMHVLVAAGEIVCMVQVVRAPRWWQRVLALLGVAGGALALETIRRGASIIVAIGAIGGIGAAWGLPRPRILLAGVLALLVVGAGAVRQPVVQDRLLALVRQGARYHQGHVLTPGYSYKALEGRYYQEPGLVRSMPAKAATAFVVTSLVNFVAEPRPWAIDTRAMLAYVPEQMVWYVLVALVPVGIIGGIRKDALLTGVLVAHALGVMALVAIPSGNIGTLIRHRGLALPYVAWLAVLGASVMLSAVSAPAASKRG